MKMNLIKDGKFNAKDLGKDLLVFAMATATLYTCRKFTTARVCDRLMGAAYQDIDGFSCLVDAYADKFGSEKLVQEGKKFWDAVRK